MISTSIASLTRGRLRKHRFASVAPIEKLWNDFLGSKLLGKVKESYYYECYQQGSVDAPKHESLVDLWMEVLRQGIPAWEGFVLLGEDAPREEQQNVWDTICFLLKGIFYLANNISLAAMECELPTEFVLHAAVFVLPLIRRSGDEECEETLVNIFQRAFSLYSDQVHQSCRIMGRYPLHIAATNKCSLTDMSNHSSKVSPPRHKGVEVVIFDMIAKTSPTIAASTRDAQGKYPLHSACASGHSWLWGLEDLFHAAPQVARSCHHPNPFMLMAQGALRSIGKPSKKRGLLRKLCCKGLGGKPMKETISDDQDRDQLNTVFQFFQADPVIVLSLLR